MKTKISSHLSSFYRYVFGPLLLVLHFVFFLLEDPISINQKNSIPTIAYCIGALLIIIFLWNYLWKITEVWKDEDYIYIGKKQKMEKVPWANIIHAWQASPFRIFRFLFISYKDDKGEIRWIRFIGHFEMDYKGKHHPEVSRLLKKIKEDL